MLLEMFCWIILANSVKSEVNIKIGKCFFFPELVFLTEVEDILPTLHPSQCKPQCLY